MNTKKKSKNIIFYFPKWVKGRGFVTNRFDKSTILANGLLITCIILSLASGFIDLTFFSGLSKSSFYIGTFPIKAAVLYTVISIGFILGKFWCAMKIGMLKELKSRLIAKGKSWANNLNKVLVLWHLAHKFLIAVSIITAISLSIVSIGDGIRKNQNEILKSKTAYEKIAKYSSTADVSDEEQFKALVKGTNASSTAADKAAIQAAEIWPIIEDYREDRAAFEAEFGNTFESKEEVVYKGQTIIPDEYWDKQNSLVISKVKAKGRNLSINQIRNITSEAVLVSQIKNEIEASVANTSLDSLAELADKTSNKAKQEIENLEGRFTWPDGSPVVFDPNNVSKSLQTLADIQSAYENDSGDVGQSAKMFMIVGPALENKFANKATLENITEQKTTTNSFGTTEIMMMALIMIFGIVQEFLIAIFTPKATIDRKMLSQVSQYLLWSSNEEKERFLISVYKDYVGDGIISQEDFNAKCKKCVELMEETEDDIITKFSKKELENPEVVRLETEVDKYKQQAEDYLATSADFHDKLMKETEKNEQLTNDMLAKDDLVQDLKYKLAQKENEIESHKIAEVAATDETKTKRKIERKIVKEPKEQEFSSTVDEKAKEVEALLK